MANVAITGAGRGIGLELARQHLAGGDRVFALARSSSAALDDLAADSGGMLTVHAMDVASDESVRSGAADTGGAAIDILYNVAGVTGPSSADELHTADWHAWDEAMSIMVYGPLRVLQAFLPRLEAGSRVVNISSQIGASTWPTGGYYAYGAAKAALNRMMRSVSVDLKDRGIVVGLVHPGWVQTDMGGPGADLTVEQSASGIKALAEGWTIERSGGFYKWNGEPHAW